MIIAPVSSPYPFSNTASLPAPAATRYAVSNASLPLVSSGLASQAMNPSVLSQLNRSSLHFSGCFCPICASMAIIVESHEKVKKIQSGDGIVPGDTMKQIARKTGFNYVPHERATRLAFPARNDVESIEKAAMERTMQQNSTVRLEIPNESSLFSAVSAALMTSTLKTPHYETHRNDLLYSPMSTHVLEKTAGALQPQQYQVITILHHMQNADEKVTKPVSLGYLLTGQVLPNEKELSVLSVRPLPGMENMMSEAGGLGNLLASTAGDKDKRFDTVAVSVESEQKEVQDYLKYLNKLGLPIKRYVTTNNNTQPNGLGVVTMPQPYQVALGKLYPKSFPSLYQVDIRPIRTWLENGLPQETMAHLKQLNSDAARSLEELRKANGLGNSQIDLTSAVAMLAPPAPPGARKPIPRDD